jgi:hypothetical protein
MSSFAIASVIFIDCSYKRIAAVYSLRALSSAPYCVSDAAYAWLCSPSSFFVSAIVFW